MKKRMFVLTLAMLFALSACGKNDSAEPTNLDGTATPTVTLEATAAPTIEPEATAAPTIEPEATAAPTAEPEATATPTAELEATAAPTVEPEATATPTAATDAELPAAYTEVITRYVTALTEAWDAGRLEEDGLAFIVKDCVGDDALAHIGYAIVDIDGDGILELAIGTTERVTDEFYGKLLIELYTMEQDGACVKVFTSRHRWRYYYAGESLFAHLASGSANDSVDTTMQYEGGSLRDLDRRTERENYVRLELTPMSQWGL